MAVKTRLKIGELFKQTGIAVGALRYYESLGLLRSERGDNGYRYYSAQAVHQVQFIKKAQSLGFSLEDIGEVLNVHEQAMCLASWCNRFCKRRLISLRLKFVK